MKHTNFYDAIKAIEEQAKHELAEAVKVIGGIFTPDYDNGKMEIVVVGAFKHCPGSEDILVTKVEVTDNNCPIIYGKSYQCRELEEEPIYFLEPGYIHFIIDAIPETEGVESVADLERSEETAEVVRIILMSESQSSSLEG